jgi:hypothetical protein
LRSLLLIFALSLSVSTAFAGTITTNVTGAFVGGGSASGGFSFDPAANPITLFPSCTSLTPSPSTPGSAGYCGTYSGVNVTTTPGAAFLGANYQNVCGQGVICTGVAPNGTQALLLTSNSPDQIGLTALGVYSSAVGTAFEEGVCADSSCSSPTAQTRFSDQSTTYNYTGQPMATPQCFAANPCTVVWPANASITGSLIFQAPLADNLYWGNTSNTWLLPSITTYDFSDGFFTYTPSDSSITSASIATDPNGNISGWNILIASNQGGGTEQLMVENLQGLQKDSLMYSTSTFLMQDSTSNAGAWSVVSTSTPEPSSLFMLGGGLAALAAFAAGKRRRVEHERPKHG